MSTFTRSGAFDLALLPLIFGCYCYWLLLVVAATAAAVAAAAMIEVDIWMLLLLLSHHIWVRDSVNSLLLMRAVCAYFIVGNVVIFTNEHMVIEWNETFMHTKCYAYKQFNHNQKKKLPEIKSETFPVGLHATVCSIDVNDIFFIKATFCILKRSNNLVFPYLDIPTSQWFSLKNWKRRQCWIYMFDWVELSGKSRKKNEWKIRERNHISQNIDHMNWKHIHDSAGWKNLHLFVRLSTYWLNSMSFEADVDSSMFIKRALWYV